MLHAGVDIGSKTVKLVVLDDDRELLYDSYERHLSNVRETLGYTLARARMRFPEERMTIGVTGSAGMQFADLLTCRSPRRSSPRARPSSGASLRWMWLSR